MRVLVDFAIGIAILLWLQLEHEREFESAPVVVCALFALIFALDAPHQSSPRLRACVTGSSVARRSIR
jgi:hypothetical protein